MSVLPIKYEFAACIHTRTTRSTHHTHAQLVIRSSTQQELASEQAQAHWQIARLTHTQSGYKDPTTQHIKHNARETQYIHRHIVVRFVIFHIFRIS